MPCVQLLATSIAAKSHPIWGGFLLHYYTHMFTDYNIDFGKLNFSWLHSYSIEFDEITYLIQKAERAQTFLRAGGQIEVVGYTNYKKFLSVIFTIVEQKLVIEDVDLPPYETVQDIILRRLAEETE